ncbi:DUF1275 family protein [Amycolatopsis acidiphila]|uniref:DUF1275 domain-containing protein n=1 Tax=Amycolatopsis acidiphila TaxID=715473 RepID=A0A557ZWF0_9PSEU|nr:DUF1275 family protein [Amycolatopsis acidiphila]TVT16334.1 DUF1275 domain-containing protein [Amycolatopsis acidiphila]UIJ61218.1 DUF1275 family protein [Amycolatopsis acidiphila]GHG97744.1 hypothetical protein GCM10017788_77400 [Amycolatopsis acidiphila]
MRARTADVVASVALAGASGAVDLLALADLGGAFASVVTGNLVNTGFGLGTADLARILPSVTAVVAFAAGVIAWTVVWRRSLLGPLFAELVLLLGVLAGWLATGTHPGRSVALVLLALAALAMGGQSVAALRLGAATTYLTGALTNALHDLVSGKAGGRRAAARQLLALVLGALAAAGLRGVLRWAVPVLPVVLLVIAITAVLVRKRG